MVVGSNGAIGSALVRALQADPRCAQVYALCRRSAPAVDVTDEGSVAAAAAEVAGDGPLQLVLCATGALHIAGQPPEKRLGELDPATMARAFALNTIGPALVVKHFHPLLARHERSLLGVLSARVGSIGDNRLGGWYSYRASKAALNQLVHTSAIEVARQRPRAVLVALHPGTVASALSAAIIGDAEAATPEQAAVHLLKVLDDLPAEGASGGFYAWDGQPIVW